VTSREIADPRRNHRNRRHRRRAGSGGFEAVVRSVVGLSLAAVICLGPAHWQVFQGPHHFVPRWIMFRDMGLGFVEVHYEREDPSGARFPIDRFDLMGYDGLTDAPKYLRQVENLARAEIIGRRLCNKLEPDSRVYVRARKPTRRGWEPVGDPDRNLCKPKPGKPDAPATGAR